jgi:putative salt-induced outer membrane protein
MPRVLTLSLLAFSLVSAVEYTQAELDQAKKEKAEAQAQIKAGQEKLEKANSILSENKLITHTELSYIKTNGNTNTESFALDARAKQKWDRHNVKAKLEAAYSEEDGVESKNKWLIEGNYDYDISKSWAFDYLIGYKSDKFTSYDYQFYTGPGAKYKALKTKTQELNLQGNILYSQDDIREDLTLTPPVYDATEEYASWRAELDYTWKFTGSTKFIQEATYRSQVDDSDNYFVTSKTAIESKMTDIFSLGISYKVDYANQVAAGTERTDETFSVSLIIDY